MHVVYLSQRLTLLNMLTQFVNKFYIYFRLLLLTKDEHSQNSTNENLRFFLFFYLKMYIIEIQQIKIFDFSQSLNDFIQTVPFWLPEYDGVYKK